MKKLFCFCLAIVLASSIAVPAAASGSEQVEIAYRGIGIVVSGETLAPADASCSAVEPFILDGTTYLPVRAVGAALGLDVGWDADSSTVILKSGSEPDYGSGEQAVSSGKKSADVTYRDIKIMLDGKALTPTDASGKAVEPFIYNGTTYLPVRAVANALGIEVDWDADSSTVYLGDKYKWLVSRDSNRQKSLTEDDVSETVYTYDESGLLLNSFSSSSTGKITDTYTYDSTGLPLTAEHIFDYNSTNYPIPFRELLEYSYDSQKRPLLTKDTYFDREGNITSSETIEYFYNVDGAAEKQVTTSFEGGEQDSVSEELYDEAGNLSFYRCQYSDGSWYSDTYTYNKNGSFLTDLYESYLSCCDELTRNKYIYTYDENENLLTREEYYEDALIYREEYTYDGYYNILTSSSKDYDGGEVLWSCDYKYDYTYDAAGNCVREIRSYTSSDGDSEKTQFDRVFNESGKMLSYTVVSTSDGETHTSDFSFKYDSHGRIVFYSFGAGSEHTCTDTYDRNGNLVSSVYADDSGITASQTYEYIKIKIS